MELAYHIFTPYRRQGYGEEACRAALSYGRQVLDFPGVSAYIDQENAGSLRLIEKLGFRQERSFDYRERHLCRYYLEFER